MDLFECFRCGEKLTLRDVFIDLGAGCLRSSLQHSSDETLAHWDVTCGTRTLFDKRDEGLLSKEGVARAKWFGFNDGSELVTLIPWIDSETVLLPRNLGSQYSIPLVTYVEGAVYKVPEWAVAKNILCGMISTDVKTLIQLREPERFGLVTRFLEVGSWRCKLLAERSVLEKGEEFVLRRRPPSLGGDTCGDSKTTLWDVIRMGNSSRKV